MHHCNTSYSVVDINVFVSNTRLELSSIKRDYIILGVSFLLINFLFISYYPVRMTSIGSSGPPPKRLRRCVKLVYLFEMC